MIEIKFRAWSKPSKSMSPAVPFKLWCYETFNSTLDSLDEKYVDVMQYTGHKDKNGTEVYEGDIIVFVDEVIVEEIEGHLRTEPEGQIWAVEVRNLVDGVVLCNNEKGECSNDFEEGNFSLSDCEVIGNIYENPELLK